MLKKITIATCTALSISAALTISASASAETITIATVNNGDMITMKELSSDFEAKHPDIDLKWVT